MVRYDVNLFSLLGSRSYEDVLPYSLATQSILKSNIKTFGEKFDSIFVALSGASLATALVKEALVKLYFNPHIWIFTPLNVHRELYVSLIKYFKNDGSLLRSVCGLPRVLDMLRQFYWDKPKRKALGTKPLLHPVTKAVIGERPNRSGISELRQLVLVLAEGVLRYLMKLKCQLFD